MTLTWLEHGNTIDPNIACTITTSVIRSKVDHCNSILFNMPATQINGLQLVLSSAARVYVTKIHQHS